MGMVADLGDNGVDATAVSDFRNISILSLSTLEHIGYDNEGAEHFGGFRTSGSGGLEAWAAAWDASPSLLSRIADEASEFLVTFPLGFNPRLDAVVSRRPSLRRFARV